METVILEITECWFCWVFTTHQLIIGHIASMITCERATVDGEQVSYETFVGINVND